MDDKEKARRYDEIEKIVRKFVPKTVHHGNPAVDALDKEVNQIYLYRFDAIKSIIES
jgi:hypothetical protein